MIPLRSAAGLKHGARLRVDRGGQWMPLLWVTLPLVIGGRALTVISFTRSLAMSGSVPKHETYDTTYQNLQKIWIGVCGAAGASQPPSFQDTGFQDTSFQDTRRSFCHGPFVRHLTF